LFKNHCHDNLCIQSSTSSTFATILLKIRSFRVFQMTHTKASHTLENPFLIFLFGPLATSCSYDIIISDGGTTTTPSHLFKPYQTAEAKGQCKNKCRVEAMCYQVYIPFP
jgi:hypothetical protein